MKKQLWWCLLLLPAFAKAQGYPSIWDNINQTQAQQLIAKYQKDTIGLAYTYAAWFNSNTENYEIQLEKIKKIIQLCYWTNLTSKGKEAFMVTFKNCTKSINRVSVMNLCLSIDWPFLKADIASNFLPSL
jgi:hypothetical protein